MHFLKIKGSSLHQDGKGMCPFIKPLFKCFESKNFDNLNYILLIISLKKINYSLRVVVLSKKENNRNKILDFDHRYRTYTVLFFHEVMSWSAFP